MGGILGIAFVGSWKQPANVIQNSSLNGILDMTCLTCLCPFLSPEPKEDKRRIRRKLYRIKMGSFMIQKRPPQQVQGRSVSYSGWGSAHSSAEVAPETLTGGTSRSRDLLLL